jgi:hypothetical protein
MVLPRGGAERSKEMIRTETRALMPPIVPTVMGGKPPEGKPEKVEEKNEESALARVGSEEVPPSRARGRSGRPTVSRDWTVLKTLYLDRMTALKTPESRVLYLRKKARKIRRSIRALTRGRKDAKQRQVELAFRLVGVALKDWPPPNGPVRHGLSCVDQATHAAWLVHRILGIRWRHMEMKSRSRPPRYYNVGRRFRYASHWGWLDTRRGNVKRIQTLKPNDKVDWKQVRAGDVVVWVLDPKWHAANAHAATVLYKDNDVVVTLEGHMVARTEMVIYWIGDPKKKPGPGGKISSPLGTFRTGRLREWLGWRQYGTKRMCVVRRKVYE